MTTGLFIPCFIDQLYPDTGFSMLTVLNKAKEISQAHMQFEYNPEQTCCGQLAFNAGFRDEAKHLGGKLIKDFMHYDYVVGPSASCIGMIRNYYAEMFYNSTLHNENNYLAKKIFEFSDFLVNIMKVNNLGGHFEAKITIHDACSALREYGLKDEPRQLLKNVRGVEMVEMENKDQCCGFGGTFSIKHEAISTAMAEQKVGHALDTGAKYIVSTEASCLMHLQSFINKHNLDLKTLHLADLLAKSLEKKQ